MEQIVIYKYWNFVQSQYIVTSFWKSKVA